MKFKATKKEMKYNFYYIANIGYCDAQYLLNYKGPIAYSAGVYGWACDYYDIDNVLISTGYSPLAEKNTKKDYELLKSYEDQARAITCSDIDYSEKELKINKLLSDYIKAIKTN